MVAALADEPVIVDASALDGGAFALRDLETLVIGSRRVHLTGARGWVRRLTTPGWRPSVVAGSRDAAVRSSYLALVIGLASNPEVAWLTPYPRLTAAENKLRQAAHARRLGVRTPRAAVVSDTRSVPAELGDWLAVKPLGPGHFMQPDGEARVVWTQELHRDDERLHALAGAPFLLQERIAARRHLRVVTCGARAWTCDLDAAGLPLDWRRSEAAHHAFRPARDPQLESTALSLASELGLGYSSQDWIDEGHAHVFVDLNPAGQWLFLPEPVRSEVSTAIANHLAGA